MLNNMSGKVVLVTGGTKGIGCATVESFARTGAKVYGTYYWGDNLDTLNARFAQYTHRPVFIQTDVRDENATQALISQITQTHPVIDVLIANAAFAPRFHQEYRYRNFLDSIEHNAWPLITYINAIKKYCGQPPHYVVAITSEGHRSCYISGYDYVAASKAVLETFIKYIVTREEIIINCVSPGVVDTEAFELVFGQYAQHLLRQFDANFIVQPEAIANVCVALCSGLMDAVRGQVILVDNGRIFSDNFTKWIALIERHFKEK